MISTMVAVVDEGLDLGLKISWQILVVEQGPVHIRLGFGHRSVSASTSPDWQRSYQR